MSACDGPLQGFPRDLRIFFFDQFQSRYGEYEIGPSPYLIRPQASDVAHLQFLRTVTSDWHEFPLECSDLGVVGAMDKPGGFLVREDGTVRNFRTRYTPVVLNADTRGNIFLQTVHASSVSVAIVGSDFDIENVIDAETNQLTPSAMEVARERWSRFDSWYDINLADKGFSVTATETCDGFQIFQIEIE